MKIAKIAAAATLAVLCASGYSYAGEQVKPEVDNSVFCVQNIDHTSGAEHCTKADEAKTVDDNSVFCQPNMDHTSGAAFCQ
ncbi:hypothetical protein ACQKDS_04665 [Serratia sp. NPDC078593]|uniref:hypothetical protein n=1 Tax=unclassified Serratia (in: enterobacteria) TaxID=2647522 RepID=UPI0037D40B29